MFPFGIDKHVFVVFRPRDDTTLRVFAADLGLWGTIDLADVARARAADAGYGPKIQPEFLRYCVAPFEWLRATHTRGGRAAGAPLRGVDVYLTSTVPRGGGVSSSSALVVACTVAARAANLAALPRLGDVPRADGKDALTMVACESEWHFSGVPGGIMDQFTSMHAKEGHACIIDCRKSEVHAECITHRRGLSGEILM